jgi:ribonuclease G
MIKRNTRFYPSKFGLVQITRQRVNQKLILKLEEEDPNDVKGEIEAPILVSTESNSDLERVLKP